MRVDPGVAKVVPATRARVAALVVTLLVPLFGAGTVEGLPAPFTVRVDGTDVPVAPGTTLGRASANLGLRPHSGDLLSVDRKVLEESAFPGRVLVNGRALPPSTPLPRGAVLTVLHGEDRSEGLRSTVSLPGSEAPNPQRMLGGAPGELVVTRGAVSRIAVSAVFRPTGPVNTPKAVALTFDDGPTPAHTPKILAILQKMKVPATFFVIGDLADRYPGLIRRELAAGMAVGTHTHDHPHDLRALPAAVVRRQLMDGVLSLRRLGADVSLFRPPGGSYSDRVVDAAREMGMRTVMWSVDGGDWAADATSKQIVGAVLSAVEPGSIVLLHDGGGDRSATVKALPSIIEGIRKKGLQLVPIDSGSPAGSGVG